VGIKVGGLPVLIADVWAIVHVFGRRRPVDVQALWTVPILIFPILDFLISLLLGPRAVKTTWPRRRPAQGAGTRNSVAT